MRAVLLATVLIALPAGAHEAPSGWTYPILCCGGHDCRELDSRDVSEVPDGYVVNLDGQKFEVSHSDTQSSPDGHFHACRTLGSWQLRCFWAPPTIY